MTWSIPSVLQSVGIVEYPLALRLTDCTEDDEMTLSALNLGMIAAYYNISCTPFPFETWQVD